MKACEKRRASFRRSHKMKSDREPSPEAPVGAAGNAGYSGDHPGETSDDDEASYNGYSLKGLPKNAMPTGGHKGLHSYTVMKGKAKIEVLLRQKAFYVRGAPSIRGQVTWSKFPSIRDAWIAACTKAGVLP